MLAFAPVSICCIGGSACHLRIVRYDLLTRPGKLEAPLIEHNSPRCQALNCSHVVAYEQHCTSPAGDITYFSQTLLLELSIADCKHLINYENLRIQMWGDCKSQSHVHSPALSLDMPLERTICLHSC